MQESQDNHGKPHLLSLQNPLGAMPENAKEMMYEREDSMDVPTEAQQPSANGVSKPAAEETSAEDAQLLSRKAEQ